MIASLMAVGKKCFHRCKTILKVCSTAYLLLIKSGQV